MVKNQLDHLNLLYNQSGTDEYNFGQKPFKFPPPDGFQPLTSTTLRPETVIPFSDQYVGVTTYAGNNGTQSITNFNMKPDLVWVKNMDDGVSHFIFDSVNGNNNYLRSDTTNIQDSGSSNQLSIIPRGFSVSGGGGGVGDDGKEYVCWSWKAGGNKGTFNLDDVGYSSASSVGMNVGGKNGVAYNKLAPIQVNGMQQVLLDLLIMEQEHLMVIRASFMQVVKIVIQKQFGIPDTPIKVNKSLS